MRRSASLTGKRRPRESWFRPGIVLVGLIVGLMASSAVAEASVPSSYRRSLNRIDVQLRLAIEVHPAQLSEYMRFSEIVCGLGERSEARGDSQAAQADWSTLSQTVHELDLPTAQEIDTAFGEADAGLLDLQAKFSARWRGQAKARVLKRGVAAVRRGVHSLRSATSAIAASFPAWDRRECAAAHAGIAAGIARIPAPLAQVNLGMFRLWRLDRHRNG